MKQRILSVILASVLCLGCLPATAAAAEGGFTITGSGNYTYENGVLTVQDNADLTISTSGQTSHRIVVAENTDATITLNGVDIKCPDYNTASNPYPKSAIDVPEHSSLLLNLESGTTNTLIGGYGGATSGAPGIHVPDGAELTILGTGALTVTGGASNAAPGGVGIGGEPRIAPYETGEPCGTVVILASGTVSISAGSSTATSTEADDIGGGKGPPNQDGDDGGGIRPTGNGNYVVWGNPCLPDHPNNYTIPEGATLTIPKDTSLTISADVTLTNNGIITGDGTMGGPGELTGSGIVTVFANTFQKDSALTLTIDGAVTSGDITHTAYGNTITLKAQVEQTNTRTLSAGDYNTVTFYVGTGESKKELGTAKVENNEASLTNVKITAENGWGIDENTITAEFSGYSHLKPATGTATLTVVRAGQTDVPSAPAVSKASPITDTSVTLETMSGGVAGVEYGCTTDPSDQTLYKWQDSPTFSGLTPGTTYAFYARYAGNKFYLASASSNTGLKVVTAPAADAVTINYINENITFDIDKVEVNPSKEFTGIDINNEGDIRAHMGSSIYVRVYSSDTDVPIRGVTELKIPYRPASPSPKSISASAENQQDGKIINLTPNADYQISTDNNTDNKQWTDRTADANGVISNLAAGTYWVRTKATPTQFAGASDSVTIGVGNVITIELPTFDSVYAGYTQPDPKRIKIHNSSDEEIQFGILTADGKFILAFDVAQDTSKVSAHGTNTRYSLQPASGLSPGEHTTTITVTYGNGQTVTATAHFTVLSQPTSEDDRGDGGDDSEPTYSNRIEKTRGGDVRVSVRTPEEGQKVTITPEPDSGYEVSAVIVTGAGGRAVKVTGHGDGTWSFRQPDERVTIHVAFREIGAALPFTDVPEGAWYYDGVKYAYENGLMAGTGGSAFSPEGVATRGQIVTILWRLAGSPGMEDEIWGYPYADVDANAYYATAVYWARMNGIASGYTSQQFGPNDTITREQLAAMLYRFAGDQGWDTSARADLSRYADAGQVSAWAVDALRWANAEGLIAGTSAATLTPGATATRAQVAVILMRFCENIANT